MSTRIITAMFACFFGSALIAACDPHGEPPFDIVPTIGNSDDVAGPGACSEAESQQACSGTITCVWSNDRCMPKQIAAAP